VWNVGQRQGLTAKQDMTVASRAGTEELLSNELLCYPWQRQGAYY